MTDTVYFIVLAMAMLGMSVIYTLAMHRQEKNHEADRQLWHKERQMLIDRIQAPSFDHYKHAEAKIIKAQKEEPKRESELIPV